MRRAALSLIGAVALLATLAAAGSAHLVPSGADTLLGMMAAADGLLLARSAAATRERGESAAATPFLARETIAGSAPTGGFVLDQEAPILRYAELQDALLLVVRREEPNAAARWISVQPAGAAILIDGGSLDEASRDVLRRLWTVAHPSAGQAAGAAAGDDHGVTALIDALSLPQPKLRALAFLDLSKLAAAREHFTAAAVERLANYGDRPGDDAELAPAVRDLGRKLAGPASTVAAAGTEKRALP